MRETSNIIPGAEPIVDERPVAVDQATMTCNECKSVRVVPLSPPLVGSESIVGWLKSAPTPCPECGNKQLSLDMRTCNAAVIGDAPSGNLDTERP